MLKIDKKDEQKVYDSIGKAIEEFSVEKVKSAKLLRPRRNELVESSTLLGALRKREIKTSGMTDEARIKMAQTFYKYFTSSQKIPDWLESNESLLKSNKVIDYITDLKRHSIDLQDQSARFNRVGKDWLVGRIQSVIGQLCEFDKPEDKNRTFNFIQNRNQLILDAIIDFTMFALPDDVNFVEFQPVFSIEKNDFVFVENSNGNLLNELYGIKFPPIKFGKTRDTGALNKRIINFKKAKDKELFLFEEIKDSLERGYNKLTSEVLDFQNKGPLDYLNGKVPFSVLLDDNIKAWLAKTQMKKVIELYNSLKDESDKEKVLRLLSETVKENNNLS